MNSDVPNCDQTLNTMQEVNIKQRQEAMMQEQEKIEKMLILREKEMVESNRRAELRKQQSLQAHELREEE